MFFLYIRFEVGKLTDQSLDSFISELDKVSKENNEGEAQRYFDHALILRSTIEFLRNNSQVRLFSGFKQIDESQDGNSVATAASSTKVAIEDEPMALDLLRCESLASLDEDSRQRILAKNYSILFSMAPYSSSGEFSSSPPITSDSPYHFGPAIPEMNSVWFRLFLYELIEDGPSSLFIPKGHRLTHLPGSFKYFDRFMVITWGHDPIISTHFNILITLNEALSHGPILVQCYSTENDEGGHIVNMAFNDNSHPLFNHPSVVKLHDKLGLKHFIGYISLVNTENSSFENEKELNFDEWTFLDLRFGLPLFDSNLNNVILNQIKYSNLACLENLQKSLELNRKLSLNLIDFIQRNQLVDIVDKSFLKNQSENSNSTSGNMQKKNFNLLKESENQASSISGAEHSSLNITNNINSHLFSDLNSYLISHYNNCKTIKKSSQSNVVLYPTQCVLFQNGKIELKNF